jgi:hypothetical protein
VPAKRAQHELPCAILPYLQVEQGPGQQVGVLAVLLPSRCAAGLRRARRPARPAPAVLCVRLPLWQACASMRVCIGKSHNAGYPLLI